MSQVNLQIIIKSEVYKLEIKIAVSVNPALNFFFPFLVA